MNTDPPIGGPRRRSPTRRLERHPAQRVEPRSSVTTDGRWPSARSRSTKSSTGTPRSTSPPRGFTPTVPSRTSSSPTTSTYGIFSSLALRMRSPSGSCGLDEVGAEALGPEPVGEAVRRRHRGQLDDRQHPHLHRRQPRREARRRSARASTPKNRSIEPNSARWIMIGRWRCVVGADVLEVEALGSWKSSWIVDICQRAADRVAHVDVDLRPVERAVALVRPCTGGPPSRARRAAPRWPPPTPRRSPTDFSGPRRELGLEVARSRTCAASDSTNVEQRGELVGELLGRAEDVRVVLREAAHAREAVQHAGALVPVHRAELEQPQRQLAVRLRCRDR